MCPFPTLEISHDLTGEYQVPGSVCWWSLLASLWPPLQKSRSLPNFIPWWSRLVHDVGATPDYMSS